MDTIVFDIETQNFFTDPDVGWDNFSALRISVVGAYSYAQDRFFMFEESQVKEMAKLFAGAKRLVGFSMNRYDVPVLNNYFQKLGAGAPNLWSKDRVDLLEEIELVAKQKVSLGRLAEMNLGIKKERHGSEAIALYRDGKMDELKAYCMKDVEITKALYDLYNKENSFVMPDKKTGEAVRVSFAKPVAVAGLF